MAKNKYIYGTVCKSRSVPNPSTALTENLPETNRRGWNVIRGMDFVPEKSPVRKEGSPEAILQKNEFSLFSQFCLSCNLNDAYDPLGGSHQSDG